MCEIEDWEKKQHCKKTQRSSCGGPLCCVTALPNHDGEKAVQSAHQRLIWVQVWAGTQVVLQRDLNVKQVLGCVAKAKEKEIYKGRHHAARS